VPASTGGGSDGEGVSRQVSCIRYHVSGIRYQVSGIRYQVSGIRYQVSTVRSTGTGVDVCNIADRERRREIIRRSRTRRYNSVT